MRCFAPGHMVRKYDKLSLKRLKPVLLPQHCVYINLGNFHSFRNTKELRNGENREKTWFLNLGLGDSGLYTGGKNPLL